MGRAVQVASAVLVIAAVACVLVTPDLGDDVDGVIHRTPLDMSPVLDTFVVPDLIDATPVFLLFPVRYCNRAFQLVDLICARLC